MILDRGFSRHPSFAAAEGEHLRLCGGGAEDDPEASDLRWLRESGGGGGGGGASGRQRSSPEDHRDPPEEDEAGGAGGPSAER